MRRRLPHSCRSRPPCRPGSGNSGRRRARPAAGCPAGGGAAAAGSASRESRGHAHIPHRACAAAAASGRRRRGSRLQVRNGVRTVGAQRQVGHRDHRIEVQFAIEMREQLAAPRRLPFQAGRRARRRRRRPEKAPFALRNTSPRCRAPGQRSKNGYSRRGHRRRCRDRRPAVRPRARPKPGRFCRLWAPLHVLIVAFPAIRAPTVTAAGVAFKPGRFLVDYLACFDCMTALVQASIPSSIRLPRRPFPNPTAEYPPCHPKPAY